MNDWSLLLWITAAVAGLGLLVVLWSFCFDWLRNLGRHRLRCPKCWYDMRSAPSLVCSECGHDAVRERRLRKSRRRWKWASVGFLIALVAGGLHADQRYELVDWIAVMPTWLLVKMVEDVSSPQSQQATFMNNAPPADPSLWTMNDELWKRYSAGELTSSQRAAITRKQFGSRKNLVSFTTREQWPVGVPIWVDVTSHLIGPFSRDLRAVPAFEGGRTISMYYVEWYDPRTRRADIGTPPPNVNQVDLDIRVREGEATIWRSTQTLDTVIEGTIDDLIEPAQGTEATTAFTSEIKRSLTLSPDREWLILTIRRLQDITVAADFTILHGDDVVASSQLFLMSIETLPPDRWGSGRDFSEATEYYLRLQGDLLALQEGDLVDGEWQVDIRGDGGAALRDFLATRYWSGELTVSLSSTPGE